jgi:hypothetical protein
MTIRQREPLIKHQGDTETLPEVSISLNGFMRENSTCQYKHAGAGVAGDAARHGAGGRAYVGEADRLC